MTVLGQHTVNETLDLIRAKDTETGAYGSERAALPSAPDATWDDDWATLLSKYTAAKSDFDLERTTVTAATPLVSDDWRTTETTYQGILRSLQQVDGTVSPGDLQDLANRFLAAGGKAPDVGKAIQPTAPDADLNAYKAADAGVQDIAKAGTAVKGALTSKWVIGGACVAGLVGLVALKSMVPRL